MFHLELTEQELAIVAEALGNMPFRSVVNLVAKIQTQVNLATEQAKPKKKAVDG